MAAGKHTCPHGGKKPGHKIAVDPAYPGSSRDWKCGELGWLCDMCRRDADREDTARLVEGLALAGLLAAKTGRDERSKAEGMSGVEFLRRAAAEFATVLRER